MLDIITIAVVGAGLVLALEEIAKKSLEIAAEICVYTNQSHTIEILES